MKKLIVILIIVSALFIGGCIGWSYLDKEHKEAINLPLSDEYFANLKDGEYTGHYEGGMYKWRTGTVKIVVESGKLVSVKLIESAEIDPEQKNVDYVELLDRVIGAQSFEVDVISGASLTSRALLKAVEDALAKARN